MTSLLKELLRKQSPTRIIATFNKPQPPILTPPPLTLPAKTQPPHHCTTNPIIPFSGFPKTQEPSPSFSLQFYPSFPFGFVLNPISSSGFLQSEADNDVSGDSQTIWVDSVKKKRKRKMNKHKLNKLRKRLRRKT